MKKLTLFLTILITLALARTGWCEGIRRTGITPGLGLSLGGGGKDEALYSGTGWTYSYATGIWTPNPTQTELVANGNMETGNPPSSWVASNSTLAASADVPTGGGLQSLAITNVGANYGRAQQDIHAVIVGGNWFKLLWSGKRGSSASVRVRLIKSNGATGSLDSSTSLTGWIPLSVISRFASDDYYIGLVNGQNTDTHVNYFDNVSLLKLTQSTLFLIRNFGSQKNISAQLSNPTLGQGGVFSRYTNYNNCVVATHDRTNAILYTVINGAWTALITTPTAYVQWNAIEIRWADANTAQLWYGGVQIGANQNVSTVPAGNYAGCFSTSSDITFKAVTHN